MPTIDPAKLSTLLAQAYKDHVPVPADVVGAGPATLEQVYAVQSAVMQELGPNGGFKTARPDPAKPNVMAPIPASRIRPTPARFERDEMRLVGVEIELAFRIDSALPDRGSTNYDEDLRAAISAVPVIEMVDSRLADRDGASDFAKLADNQSGFGLVTGAPVKKIEDLNLTNPAVEFTVDGRQVGPTTGQIPGTVDGFQVLKDFLAVVDGHCGGIAVGHYVTTGALTGLHWAEHGSEVAGSVAGLGSVSVTIGK